MSGNPETRLQRGFACEQIAADYFLSFGVKILTRNFRCRWGEIDLVGLDAGILIVAEVRQRANNDYGGALGSIDWRKQRKIIRTTQSYLQRHSQWRNLPLRFDVLALTGTSVTDYRIVWIKAAFGAR